MLGSYTEKSDDFPFETLTNFKNLIFLFVCFVLMMATKDIRGDILGVCLRVCVFFFAHGVVL